MNKKHILLFSSDATELYKADIFRVLALPNEHTIQFRYERKYVLDTLRDNPSALVGRDAVIFFLAGNVKTTEPKDRVLTRYPIRACKIKDAFHDKGTEQLILILELQGFTSCEIDADTDVHRLPLTAFVTEADLKDLRASSWIDRVRAVEAHFENTLFYRLEGVLLGTKLIKPSYSASRRRSFYELIEEKEYSIECNCYDRTGGVTPLQIRCESNDVFLLNLFESGVRARLDTQRIPLTTRGITSGSAPAYAVFWTGESSQKDPNQLKLYWRIVRNPVKTTLFGVLTIAAAIGLGLSQRVFRDATGNLVTLHDALLQLLGVILLALAAAQLFRFFNKT